MSAPNAVATRDRTRNPRVHSAPGVLSTSSFDNHTNEGKIVATPAAMLRRLSADERGEGVISTGIAVLIMALIGAAMWVAFSGVFNSASDSISENVECTTTNSCTDTTGGGGGTGGG